MKLLLIAYLILKPAGVAVTQRFPQKYCLDNLVDHPPCTLEEEFKMVAGERITKKAYEAKERMGANGSGKDRLKVLYQNGGAKEKTIEIIQHIETMLSKTRPHVFFMSECLLDEETKSRLENRHNFVTESLGDRERIWAAVRNTVPYTRRRDLEQKGITSIWLEFGQEPRNT